MFRFSKLLNALVNPTDADAQRAAESELGAVRQGGQMGGVVLPADAVASIEYQRIGARVLSSSTGAGVIETEHRGEDFVESLLAENFALQRARTYSGLNGTVHIPAEDDLASASWRAETQASEEQNPTIRQIVLTPKRLFVSTDVSRALLAMGNPDVEDLIKRLLSRVISRAIDKAIFYGTGSNNQPTGIASMSDGNTDIALTTVNSKRGDKVWEALGEAEFNLADNNTEEDAIEAIISPLLWYTMRFKSYDGNSSDTTPDSKMAILPNRDSLLLEQYPQRKSGAIANGMFMGDFSQVTVGQWVQGFEVMTNPYVRDTEGVVRISISTLVDIQFSHKKAFQQVTVG